MDQDIEQYLVITFFFMITICFFLAWFYWQRARHRELMAMIEKGMDPASHIATIGRMVRKIAYIIVGVGAGAAAIEIFKAIGYQKINGDSGTLASFAICIGIAMLLSTRSEGSSKGD